jgi:hypothetical protein
MNCFTTKLIFGVYFLSLAISWGWLYASQEAHFDSYALTFFSVTFLVTSGLIITEAFLLLIKSLWKRLHE